jgi:hypothetical protein
MAISLSTQAPKRETPHPLYLLQASHRTTAPPHAGIFLMISRQGWSGPAVFRWEFSHQAGSRREKVALISLLDAIYPARLRIGWGVIPPPLKP